MPFHYRPITFLRWYGNGRIWQLHRYKQHLFIILLAGWGKPCQNRAICCQSHHKSQHALSQQINTIHYTGRIPEPIDTGHPVYHIAGKIGETRLQPHHTSQHVTNYQHPLSIVTIQEVENIRPSGYRPLHSIYYQHDGRYHNAAATSADELQVPAWAVTIHQLLLYRCIGPPWIQTIYEF